jgi:metal-responsive CopG/Arc/MetJ family transcriptional regulator
MEVTVVHAHLPRDLAERLDTAAASELRSRSNMVARLVDEGLRRRSREEPADAVRAERG